MFFILLINHFAILKVLTLTSCPSQLKESSRALFFLLLLLSLRNYKNAFYYSVYFNESFARKHFCRHSEDEVRRNAIIFYCPFWSDVFVFYCPVCSEVFFVIARAKARNNLARADFKLSEV